MSNTKPLAPARAGFAALIAKFDAVYATGHAYPCVWIQTPGVACTSQYDIKLYRAGRASKYPGAIVMTCGKEFFGRIMRRTNLPEFSRYVRPQLESDIILALQALQLNLESVAQSYGNRTGNCCFCGRALIESFSAAHGYGPICAARWALPHEQNGTAASAAIDIEWDEVDNSTRTSGRSPKDASRHSNHSNHDEHTHHTGHANAINAYIANASSHDAHPHVPHQPYLALDCYANIDADWQG